MVAEKKYIFVYGAGISGQGVAEVLARHGKKVILYNDEPREVDPMVEQILVKTGGKVVMKEDPTPYLKASWYAIISPGIPFTTATAQKAKSLGVEVIGEVEQASRLYTGKWVGVTGTNGKTTTTTLLGEMLATLPVKTAVGGNIGFALSKETEQLDKDSYIAAELSSFQLEGIKSLRVNIALILNITPDHIERHGNMDNYILAKANIFKYQTKEDVLILNADDPIVKGFAPQAKARVCFISCKEILPEGVYIENGSFTIKLDGKKQVVCPVKDMKIFGAHNEQNALGAIACAYFAGVTPENMARVLRSFKGVEHRIEYVRTINAVPYYNDSKATNTDSTIKALEAFQDGHIILLAGGHDKMTDLTEMMNLVKTKTDALILLGEAKERFNAAALKAGVKNIYLVNSFQAAVDKAHELAKAPQVVLLSPACSSYDMFDNFPQRGRVFKEMVHKL